LPTPKTSLDKLIVNTNLEKITDNDQSTIENAIINMNPDAIDID
jgi:hypothetical protein